jgi:hypothetical protein
MSEKKTEGQIAYEKRLRRRLKILQQKLKEGKIKIVKGLDIEKSFMAVRMGPDGEIDIDTVDGLVRSIALGVTELHDREEQKKSVSLSEIQNMYFRFIEQNFGHFYNIMIERDLTPHDAGRALTQSEKNIEEITEGLEQFLSVIDVFWEQVGDVAHIHVEDMDGNIKGVFGGDLFPAHDEN